MSTGAMTGTLLAVGGLEKQFVLRRSLLGDPTFVVRAVDGVSFTLRAGETLALVGESGSGKSTVGRLVLRLIEPTGGRVVFDGRDVFALDPAALQAFRRDAQLVFQDPYASLNPRMLAGDILAEPLKLHAIVPRSRRHARVAELLDLVGLNPKLARRYPHEFSGGQRQRIAIARALAVEPRLIVCDEPVSSLDVSIRAQVLNLLHDLRERLGLAYLFISHDLAVVKHIADRIAVMNFGRIVETAPAETLFATPRHPYTRALLSAIPVPRPRAKRERIAMGDMPSALAPSVTTPPVGCHFNPRCPFAVERCQTERPPLADDGSGHATACHRWAELPAAAAVASEQQGAPVLDRLIAAFEPADVRADSDVDTVGSERTGAPALR